MVMGLGSNFNESKQVGFYHDVEYVHDEKVSDCPICLEPLVYTDDDRTLVRLRCDHQFHLDCIGSAFNAKNKMQCPNCRNVEQGRWLYATGVPIPDFNDNRISQPQPGLFTDLAFGMELCPFEASSQLNHFIHPNMLGPNVFNHEPIPLGGQQCPYIEYTVTFPQFPVAGGVTESSNSSSQWTTGLGDVSHHSNPSHMLIPLSLLPTNPRIFMSVLEPGVIRARHYFTHPVFSNQGSSPIGGFGGSLANVPMFPPGSSLVSNVQVANAPMVPPYIGDNLVTNAPIAQPYLGSYLWAHAALANASMARPYLGNNAMPHNWLHQLLVRDLTSFMGGLPPPVWHGHVFPYGQGQLARGASDYFSTSSGLNQVHDNELMRFHVRGHEPFLESTQHYMERYLAHLTTANFTEGPLLYHTIYGGGGGNGSRSSHGRESDNSVGGGSGINDGNGGSDRNSVGGGRSG